VKTLLFRPLPTAAQDLALLVARVLLGVVLIAHGWQKLDQQGFGATADGFGAMGIPLPDAAAAFAIAVELIGGALLVLGFLTPLVGVLVAADMAGAFWYVHRGTEVFSSEGGWELVAVLGALGLALACVGAGRISVDGAVRRVAGPTGARERELVGADA
jgi:putative oxidoreductase